MRARLRVPVLKIGATGAGPPALDHNLCVRGLGPGCRSVAVTLPDGTTAAVGTPDARLACDRVGWGHRSRHHRDGRTIEVANALSPAGAGGPTPVALVTGRRRWTCALTTPGPVTARFGRRSPRVAPTTLARFECFGVEYPSRDAVRFTTPSGVRVAERFRVDGRGPAVLCLPTDPGIAATASGAGADALVCFDTRVRGWWWGPQLCVPSSTGGDPPPVGVPAPTTGSSSTTTTTTTPITQPCAGVIIDGVCVINL